MQVFGFLKKYILIINNNGLGDYILVRNYLKYFKKCPKYRNHKIIFLAKSDRIDFIKHFDKKCIDIILPFSYEKYSSDINYQTKMSKKLNSFNITDIINIGCACPDVDIEPQSTIDILSKINSINKIAHVIEPKDRKLKEKYHFYTKIIYTPNNDLFEFERNKLFFEKLMGIKINEPKVPYINIKAKKQDKIIGIAPFKRDNYIPWKLEHWAELCNMLLKKYSHYKLLLIGTKENAQLYNKFAEKIENKSAIINGIQKYKSSELPSLIASLELLLSVETSTVHIASAVGTQTICLSTGAFYKRFQPIPSEHIKYIYPNEFEKWLKTHKSSDKMNMYSYKNIPYKLGNLDIKTVFNKIEKALK